MHLNWISFPTVIFQISLIETSKPIPCQGHIVNIHLDVTAVAGGHQDFASLLFPWCQTTIEVAAGDLPTFMTADGSFSDSGGDRHHSFSLACVTFEVCSSTDDSKGLSFGHMFFTLFSDFEGGCEFIDSPS